MLHTGLPMIIENVFPISKKQVLKYFGINLRLR